MSGIRGNHIRAALFTVPLVVAGVLASAVLPAEAAPRYGKSLTCRKEGVDPEARVRAKGETVIHASLSTVWKVQTDVERWPSWQAAVKTSERVDHGPLRQGSAFRWTTPVPPNPATPATSLDITSTVKQLKRGSCIRWTGPAIGEGLRIDGVHVWNFTKVKGGVLVRTEETHRGEQVDADVPAATKILSDGLQAWLSELKTAAEARGGHRPH
ncbi:SRPBCC family protein [Streptomyces tsukubensis]|uniref:Polyketide cyclase /reductase n=1 Tax=Streptomyces tsukubensis TaxID=83656 RepID=A0A1V4A280_9ACTN|nr:SRPBCC family protein [Streptomyces tsukubensis]OON73455.1 polyketide cyclase /reductase [Streptomyces tsukubensis]QFR96755.1 polyketide cyclase /reductase [Streptomyces tsukubensis]